MPESDSTFNDLQSTTTMNKLFSGAIVLLVFCLLMPLASCDRLLSVETDRFLSSDKNLLTSPNDTVFSILGILSKMQKLADRNVLTGELRADLMDVTVNSSNEIRDLNNFTVDPKTSPFADVRDYYAVINNCNYFISKADTMVTVRGERVYKKEINAAKAIRVWTYLQLGLNYGEATYYSDPVLSVNDLEKNYPLLSYPQLIDSLIEDVEDMEKVNPLVNTAMPDYGEINGVISNLLFIDPLFLLGDLYLWKASQTGNKADYESAASSYAKLIEKNLYIVEKGYAVVWQDGTYSYWMDSWSNSLTNTKSSWELISLMKLVASPFDGTPSKLGSMCKNFELCGSTAYQKISDDQIYCFKELSGTIKYTTGDLRAIRLFDKRITNSYLNESQMLINKYDENVILIYRVALLYLRYAEAVNRAGKPNLAFAVLKYGLNASTLALIPAGEISDQKPYVTLFQSSDLVNSTYFDYNMGVHSRGSGSSESNAMYIIPDYTPASTDSTDMLAAKTDSINFVEGSICDELALETAFEGNRFQDLIRMSDHRKDPTFLAKRVAAKHSDNYDYYLTLLSDRTKWFISPR